MRVTKDVLNRTKARANKAASTGSHIKMDSFLQTKHAPGSRATPPGPYVSQYNSKYNMQTGHQEKRGVIDIKAKHPIMRHTERPVSAGQLGAVNKVWDTFVSFSTPRARRRLDSSVLSLFSRPNVCMHDCVGNK